MLNKCSIIYSFKTSTANIIQKKRVSTPLFLVVLPSIAYEIRSNLAYSHRQNNWDYLFVPHHPAISIQGKLQKNLYFQSDVFRNKDKYFQRSL